MSARRACTAPTAILAIILLLAGCSHVLPQQASPPQVQLTGFFLAGISVFIQSYKAELTLRNPNDFALPLEGLKYRLSLDGQNFADGVTSGRIVLPPGGEKTITIPIQTEDEVSVSKIREWRQRKIARVPYALQGSFGLENKGGQLSFDSAGTVSLASLRPIRIEAEDLPANQPR